MKAIILDTRTHNNIPQALVVFTNEVDIKTDSAWTDVVVADLPSFTKQLQGQGNLIPARSAFIKSLTPGQVIDLTPDSVIPPTQAELDKQQFFKDLGRLQSFKQFKDPTDKELTDLLAKINAEYKAEYFV